MSTSLQRLAKIASPRCTNKHCIGSHEIQYASFSVLRGSSCQSTRFFAHGRTNKQVHPITNRLFSTSLNRGQSESTNQEVENSSKKANLASLLAKSIREFGPLSVSTFMNVCLQDPGQGYYASANSTDNEAMDGDKAQTRDVLGARGDFITSPEISQVFGELIAIFFIARWQAVNPEGPTRLVEFGPGKGTLLADMLRVGRYGL